MGDPFIVADIVTGRDSSFRWRGGIKVVESVLSATNEAGTSRQSAVWDKYLHDSEEEDCVSSLRCSTVNSVRDWRCGGPPAYNRASSAQSKAVAADTTPLLPEATRCSSSSSQAPPPNPARPHTSPAVEAGGASRKFFWTGDAPRKCPASRAIGSTQAGTSPSPRCPKLPNKSPQRKPRPFAQQQRQQLQQQQQQQQRQQQQQQKGMESPKEGDVFEFQSGKHGNQSASVVESSDWDFPSDSMFDTEPAAAINTSSRKSRFSPRNPTTRSVARAIYGGPPLKRMSPKYPKLPPKSSKSPFRKPNSESWGFGGPHPGYVVPFELLELFDEWSSEWPCDVEDLESAFDGCLDGDLSQMSILRTPSPWFAQHPYRPRSQGGAGSHTARPYSSAMMTTCTPLPSTSPLLPTATTATPTPALAATATTSAATTATPPPMTGPAINGSATPLVAPTASRPSTTPLLNAAAASSSRSTSAPAAPALNSSSTSSRSASKQSANRSKRGSGAGRPASRELFSVQSSVDEGPHFHQDGLTDPACTSILESQWEREFDHGLDDDLTRSSLLRSPSPRQSKRPDSRAARGVRPGSQTQSMVSRAGSRGESVRENKKDQLCRSNYPRGAVLRDSTPVPGDEDEDEVKEQKEEDRKRRLWNLAVDQAVWREQHNKVHARRRKAKKLEEERKQEEDMKAKVTATEPKTQQETSEEISKVWKPQARLKLQARLSELASAPTASSSPTSTAKVAPPQQALQAMKRMSSVRVAALNDVDTELELSRARVLEEGERISQELNVRDAEEAMMAFSRYDEDGSGTLELLEVRAVLGDLGLLPQNTAEKAAVRRTLVNFVQGVDDGDSDPEDYGRPEREVDETNKREAKLARNIALRRVQLHSFITRVRARLRTTRSGRHMDIFRKFDVLETGELSLNVILKLLGDLKLFGNEQEQEKTQAFFFEWLSRIANPELPPPQPDDFDFDAPCGWYFGTKVLRGLLLGKEIDSAGPWPVNRSVLVKHVLSQLANRTFDVNEFEVFIEFLQVTRDQLALDRQRASAKEMGVTNVRLFLEFRHELFELRQAFESFDVESKGEIGEAAVWIALNSLGIVPQGKAERDIFKEIGTLNCWKYYTEPAAVPETRGEDDALPSPSGASRHDRRSRLDEPLMETNVLACGVSAYLDLDPSTDKRTVTFQGFLTVLSTCRHWLQSHMKDELRPLFDRCLQRKAARFPHDEDAVLGMREVSLALESLDMAPATYEDQQQLCVVLEEANEWGFHPTTLDFETFARLVRRVREWRAERLRKDECQLAMDTMNFEQHVVKEYRLAFDLLDEDGEGVINILGLRKFFKLLRRSITSEGLRALFAKGDERQSGELTFHEFLKLIHLYDKPARLLRSLDEATRMSTPPPTSGSKQKASSKQASPQAGSQQRSNPRQPAKPPERPPSNLKKSSPSRSNTREIPRTA